MSDVYSCRLRRGPDGRIAEKIETVQGRDRRWAYSYDARGRLTEARLDQRLICQCHYDRDGRRQRDYFPASHGFSTRDYRYTPDDRLLAAGNNGYVHDANGFRSIWNSEGRYTLYAYAPDYRLLRVEKPDDGLVFEFAHDEDGRRAVKFRDGRPVEAYRWLDFLRLAGFRDVGCWYEFAYARGERTPLAMRRDDGAVFRLHCDQIGSLRVVADSDGHVLKEVLYDPFGGIIEDSAPDLRIPIGFAGGLHDRDLGFVRFGWRDYDTFTGRWTAPDPLGDAGGDPDWYGYCLDDPVNGVDPLGLFQFGKRPLSCLPSNWHWISQDTSWADEHNCEPKHEHGFYEDGTGDNVGLGKYWIMDKEDISKYKLEDRHFDDERMRRAQQSLDPGPYKLKSDDDGPSNNCQDYADNLRERYRFLRDAERH